MDCAAYMDFLRTVCTPVSVLSQRNGDWVWRMRHRVTGQDLVVRRYHQSIAAYEQLKQVRHRYLPQVFDTITCTDGQIVLEEFVQGITVAQVLQSGLYTWHGAKHLLRELCAAVQTLHDLGLVHRDIKPENVMVTTSGTVKLLDLNASRQPQPEKDADTQVLGTIGYASPEQLGIAQSDRRTDIYALGVLLNVMLTGEHPSRLLAKGKAGRIVRKCTQIDPNSRYQTVTKLMNAL